MKQDDGKSGGYHDRLIEEINLILDRLSASGDRWDARWVAHAVCLSHDKGITKKSDHSPFWLHCGYEATRREVTRCINARAGDKPENNEAPKFAGFEQLQQYYVVVRDGEQVGVRVTDMTDAELSDKANRYRKMGASCYRHADEIDRFMAVRKRVA